MLYLADEPACGSHPDHQVIHDQLHRCHKYLSILQKN